MLLNLSVDVGPADNDERAHVSDLLAATLAKVLRHGHTATLSTNTYDEDDDDDSPEDDAYRRGYNAGFGDGARLYRLGEPAENPTGGAMSSAMTHGRPDGPGTLVVPADLMDKVRRVQSGEIVVPGVGRIRVPPGATVEFVPNDHTVPVPEGADNPAVHLTDQTDEVPPAGYAPRTTTFPGAGALADGPPHVVHLGNGWTAAEIAALRDDLFPTTMAAPTDTLPPPWLYTQVAASLRAQEGYAVPSGHPVGAEDLGLTEEEMAEVRHAQANATGRLLSPPIAAVMENYARMGREDQAAEQGSERTTVLPVATQRPDGERPPAGPGAPLSAYDSLSLSIGWDYQFPNSPEDGDGHVDPEGAMWTYNESRRSWDRRTYPAEWAPASPVNFTPVFLTDRDI